MLKHLGNISINNFPHKISRCSSRFVNVSSRDDNKSCTIFIMVQFHYISRENFQKVFGDMVVVTESAAIMATACIEV